MTLEKMCIDMGLEERVLLNGGMVFSVFFPQERASEQSEYLLIFPHNTYIFHTKTPRVCRAAELRPPMVTLTKVPRAKGLLNQLRMLLGNCIRRWDASHAFTQCCVGRMPHLS